MMHSSNGFPVLGTSKVDVSYPFKMPIVMFDDFLTFNTSEVSATLSAAKYKLAGTEATVAASLGGSIGQNLGVDGGRVRLTTASNSGDGQFMAPTAGFLDIVNSTTNTDIRPVVFQCKMNSTSITANTIACGLVTNSGLNGTTEPVTTTAFGFYFVVVNGVVGYLYKTSAVTGTLTAATYADTGAAATIAASSNNTYTVIYDGAGSVSWFLNGRLLKTQSFAVFAGMTVLPFFGLKTTEAVVKVMDVDYVYAACQSSSAGR